MCVFYNSGYMRYLGYGRGSSKFKLALSTSPIPMHLLNLKVSNNVVGLNTGRQTEGEVLVSTFRNGHNIGQ